VAEQLRRLQACRDLPLLMLTSVSFHGKTKELRAAGIAEQLRKPVKLTALQTSLKALMSPSVEGQTSAASDPHGASSQLQAGPGARILIVEDNAINQRVASALLARAGYRSEVANNGEEALSALQRMPFDLVLMDCQMPVLDGYMATRRIREREQVSGLHLPVIAMTAHALPGDQDRCLAAGMDDYLSKPVTREALYQALARWLPVDRQPRKEVA
jgi:CheY-like chemotaxis protein